MDNGYRYEDFAVGKKFHSSSFRMERDRIVSFAEEFDPQPQHLSERTAAASQFGELVASGWHTAAVSMRLFIAEARRASPEEARVPASAILPGHIPSGRETSCAWRLKWSARGSLARVPTRDCSQYGAQPSIRTAMW
jgi:acyl dehydratase